jgi:hypothetical protein
MTPSSIKSGWRHELGSHVRAAPPDYAVRAVPDRPVASHRQNELVRDCEARSMKPNAPFRNVGNDAVIRWTTTRGLDLCQTFRRLTWRLASFTKPHRMHGQPSIAGIH